MVRKIQAKRILQFRAEGLSFGQIEVQGVSRHSVVNVERAAAREGLTWETVSGMSEGEVYERLFPGRGDYDSVYLQPEWADIHKELARVGVTLKLLHAEYRDRCQSDGAASMGYDRFCKSYAHYVRTIGVSSDRNRRHEHARAHRTRRLTGRWWVPDGLRPVLTTNIGGAHRE